MLEWVIYISMLLQSAAMLLALVRLIIGPSLADRVLALDLMATIAVAIVAVYAMAYEQPLLLDVAAVLALVAFVGTIAFALYMERRLQR
jgi:multicomponent Na+:H+ antiporter subunit F